MWPKRPACSVGRGRSSTIIERSRSAPLTLKTPAEHPPPGDPAGRRRRFLLSGYAFLVLVVRIVGRRPGKQLAPFEFVLIFFIGGLALTAIVGDERSFTNAVLQVIAIALAHYAISWARSRSSRFARL
jgi:hypothetical protein